MIKLQQFKIPVNQVQAKCLNMYFELDRDHVDINPHTKSNKNREMVKLEL